MISSRSVDSPRRHVHKKGENHPVPPTRVHTRTKQALLVKDGKERRTTKVSGRTPSSSSIALQVASIKLAIKKDLMHACVT
mmetsp:Transcript_45620/g.89871  ORF Transcript_45620/g.89871 Transcript_45620/m.89871 type:complete len:81 (-) Transcript_45620:272-514(-)